MQTDKHLQHLCSKWDLVNACRSGFYEERDDIAPFRCVLTQNGSWANLAGLRGHMSTPHLLYLYRSLADMAAAQKQSMAFLEGRFNPWVSPAIWFMARPCTILHLRGCNSLWKWSMVSRPARRASIWECQLHGHSLMRSAWQTSYQCLPCSLLNILCSRRHANGCLAVQCLAVQRMLRKILRKHCSESWDAETCESLKLAGTWAEDNSQGARQIFLVWMVCHIGMKVSLSTLSVPVTVKQYIAIWSRWLSPIK